MCENPLDHIDGDPVHPRNLSRCHPVLHPGADARKLRARDLRRYPVLGVDWPVAFLVTNRRGRQRLQHTRFMFGLADRWQRVRNRLFGDPPFRREERFGCPARARDPLSLMLSRGQWSSSTKHRFRLHGLSVGDIEMAFVNLGKRFQTYTPHAPTVRSSMSLTDRRVTISHR